MDSDDDEEERLRRWKEHLATQVTLCAPELAPCFSPCFAGIQNQSRRLRLQRGEQENKTDSSDEEGPPPNTGQSPLKQAGGSPNGGARGGSSGGRAVARDSLDPPAKGDAPEEQIDWASALMPQLRELQEENRQLALMYLTPNP